MRSAIALPLFLCLCISLAFSQAVPAQTPADPQADADAIQTVEDDMLQGESTTDIAVFEKTLTDDYVNLNPHGTGPGKEKIIEGMKPHAGQAPPYSVEMHNLHVYVLGDTAVAAFIKTYTAKQNGNTDNEDITHIFVRDHGIWKLKIGRASNCHRD